MAVDIFAFKSLDLLAFPLLLRPFFELDPIAWRALP